MPQREDLAGLDIGPMLARMGNLDAVRHPGPGGAWEFEVKWDGYRALARHDEATVLHSRGGLDLMGAHPELAELAQLLHGHRVLLDGELVVLDSQGRSDFEALQNHGRPGARASHYMAFDLLHLDGIGLRDLPLRQRRELLVDLLGQGGSQVHVPATFGADADLALAASRELGLEGLIAKGIDGTYQPGARSDHWLKLKNFYTQDVVVVGWKPGSGSRSGELGSVLVAVPDATGLAFAGSVGSGFDQTGLAEARRRLSPLHLPRAVPELHGVRPSEARDIHWVRPELVAQVGYAVWTSAGRLRHPTWRGWLDRADPTTVVRGEG